MKNFKRLIACVMAIATLGSVTYISANAITEDTSANVSTYNAINPIEYVKETFESNVNEYLKTTGIDEKIKYTAIVDKDDNFTSKYNFFYYKNVDSSYSVASFDAGILPLMYFESSNANLTINDILTDEQLNQIRKLQNEDISKCLTNKGTDITTGLTEYSLYLYLPYDDGNMSYNDTVKYKYNLGKSLIDNGVVDNAYLSAGAIYDDYNSMWTEGDFIIVMNDNTKLTNDILGKYADSIQSFEKVTCKDGTTINGTTEYYKFTKSEDTEYSYEEICLGIQNNDSIKFAGCLKTGCVATALWQDGKNIQFKIPILSDQSTIGNSQELQPTGVRGDINYDGDVDGKDLMLLKKYILGLITW